MNPKAIDRKIKKLNDKLADLPGTMIKLDPDSFSPQEQALLKYIEDLEPELEKDLKGTLEKKRYVLL